MGFREMAMGAFINELVHEFHIEHDKDDVEWACIKLGINPENKFWTNYKAFKQFFNPVSPAAILNMRKHLRIVSEKFEDVADDDPKLMNRADYELQVTLERYEEMVNDLVNKMNEVDEFLFRELWLSVAVNLVNEIDSVIDERHESHVSPPWDE